VPELRVLDDRLAARWEAVADRAGADPFCRPAWMRAWWRAFGSGSFQLLAAPVGAAPAALLPVVRQPWGVASPTNEHTPSFAPPVVDPDALPELADRFFARRPAVARLTFLDRGPVLRALTAAARARGYALETRTIHASPYLELEGTDIAAYEAARRRGLMADLRRRRRRLDELGRVDVAVDGGPERLPELFELEARGWKGARGTSIAASPRLRAFYGAVAGEMAAIGGLRLLSLRLDERPLAALLAIECGGVLHLIKAGYDDRAARFAPGQLLLHACVRHAFATGLRRVEFHGAAEPYKLAWTDAVRERVALHAFASFAGGRATCWAFRRVRPAAGRLRRDLDPHRHRRVS
jgi:CelD/BcsL family acetyltransferase involved in cellulose biosynthesis